MNYHPLYPWFIRALLIAIGFAASPELAWGTPTTDSSRDAEQQSWRIDQVALQAQQKGIDRLQSLVRKKRGNAEEATLQLRLAEMQMEKASLEFRLAHARVHFAKSPLNLIRYQQALRETISTLSDQLKRFSKHEETALTLSMRAKCYEELKQISESKRDYLQVVKLFAETDYAILAHMSLADFAITANAHAEAIHHLNEVEKRPNHPQYPFALSKLAWSHYNLKSIDRALEYVKKSVTTYRTMAENLGTALPNAITALRESITLDSAIFMIQGLEESPQKYSIAHSFDWFHDLDNSPLLGRLCLRYTKLLRSQGHDQELKKWQNLVETRLPKASENFEIALVSLEHSLNRGRYLELPEASEIALRHAVEFQPPFTDSQQFAMRVFGTATEKLHKLIGKNRAHQDIQPYRRTLISLYQAFARILPKGDARQSDFNYNLAELYFDLKDYPAATEYYLKSVRDDARVKALVSRYEQLKAQSQIPRELVAQDLSKVLTDVTSLKSATPSTPVDPALAEWTTWILQTKNPVPETLTFWFESARAHYQSGHYQQSIQLLQSLVEKHPGEPDSVRAASLLLDTWLKSQRWDDAKSMAVSLLNQKKWKESSFAPDLERVALDISLRHVSENLTKKDYTRALKETDQILTTIGRSDKRAEITFMKAKIEAEIAVQNKLTVVAIEALSQGIAVLQKEASKQGDKAPADLAGWLQEGVRLRAALYETNFQLGLAADDYSNLYRKNPKDKLAPEWQEKALTFYYLTGRMKDLQRLTQTDGLCASDGKSAHSCELYRTLASILHQETAQKNSRPIKNSLPKGEGNDALAALYRLERPEELKLHDLTATLRRLAKHWTTVPSLFSVALLKTTQSRAHAAAKFARTSLPLNRLRLEERALTYRFESHQTFEAAVLASVNQIPGHQFRINMLTELNSAYVDLLRELDSLRSKGDSSELADLGSSLKNKHSEIQKLMLQAAQPMEPLVAADREIAGLPMEAATQEGGKVDPELKTFTLQLNESMTSHNWALAQFLIEKGRQRNFLPESAAAQINRTIERSLME